MTRSVTARISWNEWKKDRAWSEKTIQADTFAAIHHTHPIEAAIWTTWIETGHARVIEG